LFCIFNEIDVDPDELWSLFEPWAEVPPGFKHPDPVKLSGTDVMIVRGYTQEIFVETLLEFLDLLKALKQASSWKIGINIKIKIKILLKII
jgi:hypothetical protein